MKLNGIFGKGSGKVGESVWAVSSGVQIVRPYNPNVTNPNTDAQVEQRAKFKLMSQIATALAPAIAFKKKGLVSARNQFVSANIGKAAFENGQAKIDLSSLDLTGGKSSIPVLAPVSQNATAMPVHLQTAAPANIDAVVYVRAEYEDNENIKSVDVVVATEAGAGRTFPGSVAGVEEFGCVWAYGIIGSSSKKGISYDDLKVSEATPDGYVNVIKAAITSGSSFTMTTAAPIDPA